MLAIATTSTAERYLILKQAYLDALKLFLKDRKELTAFEIKVLMLEKQYKKTVKDGRDNAVPVMISVSLKKPLGLIYSTLITIDALFLYDFILNEG